MVVGCARCSQPFIYGIVAVVEGVALSLALVVVVSR